VSNPLYRLVLIRWLWLLVVWTEFLRRVVRLPLRFSLCHPGKAGSLGCLGHTQVFFGIITFALSAAVAGGFANLMTYEGSSIAALKFGMFGFRVAAVAVLVVPLLFLAPRLFEVKQRGLNDYGILASEYTRDFDRKWLRPAQPARESLLGTPDIQFSFRFGSKLFSCPRDARSHDRPPHSARSCDTSDHSDVGVVGLHAVSGSGSQGRFAIACLTMG